MTDLTILYYTANAIYEKAVEKIRDYLLEVTENKYPIISVSQKPINFGHNICVGEIGKTKYNLYKQILIGVREVTTKYVACAEDDTLYAKDHFLKRPPNGVFSYDNNYWFAQSNYYWQITAADEFKRGGMWGCISTTDTLLKNLTRRFEVYPTYEQVLAAKKLVWGEPGLNDHPYGMSTSKKTLFIYSKNPSVIFIHNEAMGSKQLTLSLDRHKPEDISYNLEPFGGIKKLWDTYWS